MVQKIKAYFSKRWVEQLSTGRFVVYWKLDAYYSSTNKMRYIGNNCCLLLLISGLIVLSSCGEPEIKLSRADQRRVDTLVNRQLDSISPILDSLCLVRQDTLIPHLADSIVAIRRKQEERLRLNIN